MKNLSLFSSSKTESVRFVFQNRGFENREIVPEKITTLGMDELKKYENPKNYDQNLIQSIRVIDRTKRDPENPEIDNTKRKHIDGRGMEVLSVLQITYPNGNKHHYAIDTQDKMYWWNWDDETKTGVYQDEGYLQIKNGKIEKNKNYTEQKSFDPEGFKKWKKNLEKTEYGIIKTDQKNADGLIKNFPVSTSDSINDMINPTLKRQNLEISKSYSEESKNDWIKRVQYDPFIVFKRISELKKTPYAQEILKMALSNELKIKESVGNNPELAFEYYDTYKDQSYAGEVLKIAVKYSPQEVFEYYYKYKDQPYAYEILKTAIENDPFIAFYYKYLPYEYKENLINIARSEDVLKTAAKKDPFRTIAYYNSYKDEPYAKDILNIARSEDVLKTAAKKNLILAIILYNDYKDEPYAKDILSIALSKEAFESVEEGDLDYIFTYFDNYKDEPYAKDVLSIVLSKEFLEAVVENNPDFIFKYFDKYKDRPYAKDILNIAIKQDPTLGFKYIDKYKEMTYAKDILKIALLNSNTREVIYFLENYELPPGLKNSLSPIIKDIEEIKNRLDNMVGDMWRKNTAMNYILQLNELIFSYSVSKKSLLDDPKLENILQVFSYWKDLYEKNSFLYQGKTLPEIENSMPDILLMVVRNLNFKNIPPERGSIKQEILEILSLREKYTNQKLWGNQNVVWFSNNEQYLGGIIDLFGRNITEEAIKKRKGVINPLNPWSSGPSQWKNGKKKEIDIPKSLQHFELDDNLSSRNREYQLQKFIDRLIFTPPPMTFFFEGHGTGGSLRMDKFHSISNGELADILIKRYSLYGEKSTQDIFIIAACFGHTFLRNVYNCFKEKGKEKAMPIFIGLSEYGKQAGGHPLLDTYGTAEIEHLLKSETFEDLWKYATPKAGNTNISIYVPPIRKQGANLRHIAENDSPQELNERQIEGAEIA